MKHSLRYVVLTVCLLCLAGGTVRAGLRGYWTFDDTTADASGSGLTGTLEADAWYSTEVPAAIGIGKSLDLDGTDDHFKVDVTTGSLRGAYTVSAWVRLADTSNNAVFSTRRPSDAGFDCKFIGGNLIHGDIGNGGGWIDTSADAAFNYSLNTWYHLVYVVQRTGYDIYVDGTRLNGESFSGVPLLWDAAHDIWIGKYGGGGSEDFAGQIDDVAVWDQALSAGQIQQLYAGVSPMSIGPRIDNGSFEADTFSVFPGYASGNGGSITAWSSDDFTRVGINPSSGSPFADNGVIPDGLNAGFIQNSGGTGYLRANVLNLSAGQRYRLSYRYNARNGQVPQIRSTVDTASPTLLQNDVQYPSVGGANPYHLGAYEFTAEASSHTVTFENTKGAGDTTMTLDDVRIENADAPGWTTALWTGDGTSGVDGSASYTHAINLGDAASPTINGIVFKGSGIGGNPSEAANGANYTTTLSGRFGGPDANNLSGGADGSAALSRQFCYQGGAAGTLIGFTLHGLMPGLTYETTIFGIGFDPVPASRSLAFSVNSSPEVTFNESMHGNDNGLRLSYRGTADANGSIDAIARVYNDNFSFHYYGFCNKAEPDSALILADAFAGPNGADNGANISAHAPDHANLPLAAAYVETGMNSAFHTDIENGTARLGANAGAAIDIDTDIHVKPRVMRIQADLRVGTLTGPVGGNARGVGLGFYSDGTYDVSQEVGIDFTGLVLAPDGSLYLFEDGSYSGLTVAHSGGFDVDTFYTLSYEVNVEAGTIAAVSLEGSTADYSPLTTSAFDDARTALAGITGSSSSGGTYGYVDNLIIREITAGTATGGTLFKVK